MRHLQVAERLEQIAKVGIPIATKVGNQLPKNEERYASVEHIGYVTQGIPELVIDFDAGPFAKNLRFDSDLYIACKRALGDTSRHESWLRQEFESWKKSMHNDEYPFGLETHAFYDPDTNLTHFFPLPERKLIGQQ